MIDNENFYCNECGNNHTVFYGTVVNGADLPTDIEIEDNPISSVVLSKEYTYILGEIDIEINDRGKKISFRIWSKILRADWREYIKAIKIGEHITVNCELLNEVMLYPTTRRLPSKLGFDKGSEVFKYILEGENELSNDSKNGISFLKYNQLMANYIHSLDIEIEDAVEYDSNTFDQLIHDFNANVEGQFVHARYEDEIIFQMISICNTELYQDENNCNEICIDIPVNESVQELMTSNVIKYFSDQGYIENTFDGIKIYQKKVGTNLSNIELNVKELLAVVYDINYTDVVYILETIKKLK